MPILLSCCANMRADFQIYVKINRIIMIIILIFSIENSLFQKLEKPSAERVQEIGELLQSGAVALSDVGRGGGTGKSAKGKID